MFEKESSPRFLEDDHSTAIFIMCSPIQCATDHFQIHPGHSNWTWRSGVVWWWDLQGERPWETPHLVPLLWDACWVQRFAANVGVVKHLIVAISLYTHVSYTYMYTWWLYYISFHDYIWNNIYCSAYCIHTYTNGPLDARLGSRVLLHVTYLQLSEPSLKVCNVL